jgi:hypothetical protein
MGNNYIIHTPHKGLNLLGLKFHKSQPYLLMIIKSRKDSVLLLKTDAPTSAVKKNEIYVG